MMKFCVHLIQNVFESSLRAECLLKEKLMLMLIAIDLYYGNFSRN